MLDVTALKAKIESVKNEIVQDSITPLRLGVILEELLRKLSEVYREGLPEAIQQAIEDANTALAKANTLIQLLEVAIQMHLDALGVTVVDRGPWVKGESYFYESINPKTGIVETSDVWHFACRFRCLKSMTQEEPRYDSADWLFIEGDPAFTVRFEETDYLFDPDNFNCTLTIIAELYNQDVTADILDADVVWTRYSEDAQGNPRPSSDTAWAIKRAGAGKSLALTREDCDFNGYIPKKIRFTATVTLRDGSEVEPSAQANFEY